MYNRKKAVEYARRWALYRNPKYYNFDDLGGDCTNFASQCIYAGIGVMNYSPTGWYYNSLNNRAPAWTGVNELYTFLINNTGRGPRGSLVKINEIYPGDIVQLDFDCDGTFDHSPIIIDVGKFTPDTIKIAAHTKDSLNRPLSTYNYCKIRFIHIM